MADTSIDSTKQNGVDDFTRGVDETPKDDNTVDTRNDDPTINPATHPGPDAPTGDAAVEAFPDKPEILTSDPGSKKPKTSTQETTPSDQSGDVIEIKVVDAPVLNSFVARKTVTGVYRIQRQGWIGPEALEVNDGDELKEFKKFVASL